MQDAIFGELLLDDGVYRVRLQPAVEADAGAASALLERRGFGGVEQVGSAKLAQDGVWISTVAAAPTKTTQGVAIVGRCNRRVDAVIDLWRARHHAYLGSNAL